MGYDENHIIEREGSNYSIPHLPRVCFTELKLSQCVSHDRRYGCLDIAVKRPYCFKRGGRPLVYYRHGTHANNDPFLNECLKSFYNEGDQEKAKFLQFFKPMGEDEKNNNKFIYYDESEWRIIFTQRLQKENRCIKIGDEYYLKLDGWLSGIIYPSLSIKYRSFKDYNLRKLIYDICDSSINGEPHSLAEYDQKTPPMELHLDLCQQF